MHVYDCFFNNIAVFRALSYDILPGERLIANLTDFVRANNVLAVHGGA